MHALPKLQSVHVNSEPNKTNRPNSIGCPFIFIFSQRLEFLQTSYILTYVARMKKVGTIVKSINNVENNIYFLWVFVRFLFSPVRLFYFHTPFKCYRFSSQKQHKLDDIEHMWLLAYSDIMKKIDYKTNQQYKKQLLINSYKVFLFVDNLIWDSLFSHHILRGMDVNHKLI